MITSSPVRSLALALMLTGAAAANAAIAPPDVPASLQVPAGASLYLEALATGVQIYVCARKPDATYEWSFTAPQAALSDRAGHSLGKHYAGPTWESVDGSTVAGTAKARHEATAASAIPWLLLASKSNTGNGVFSAAKFVQRIDTVGGVAPSQACSDATLGQEVRVPYSATYLFYR